MSDPSALFERMARYLRRFGQCLRPPRSTSDSACPCEYCAIMRAVDAREAIVQTPASAARVALRAAADNAGERHDD